MLRRVKLEKILAHRLREVARDKGMALSHVADRAGMSRSYFWLLLDARSSATLDAVQRIAEVLGVNPVALLTVDGVHHVTAKHHAEGDARNTEQLNPTPRAPPKRRKS